jgi:tyrosyl-tRNA synthetase
LIETKMAKTSQIFQNIKIDPDLQLNNYITTLNMRGEDRIQEDDITYTILNNFDFYKNLNIIDFMREAGINLRMGPLLSRETVKNRISTKEGLSLTEFMYQAFQGYDFLKLYEKHKVRIQIGGSDQWGNMLAGYELIKKMKNTEVVNMTFPLMTTANGQKFGKSEGNAIFLNPKLSPYIMYFNTTIILLMQTY